MSDLFHEVVPDEYIEQVVRVMECANWHTYQVLTKRSERLRDLLSSRLSFASHLDHIWWGVSVEDKKYGVPRIEHLRQAPPQCGSCLSSRCWRMSGQLDLEGIHWVIVGGESGAGARPMKEEWVVSIRQQCRSSGVPFFFKQWGGVRKSETGRKLDGKTFDEMPKRAERRIMSRDERRLMIERLPTWTSAAMSGIGSFV